MGRGLFFAPSDFRNYWPDLQISSGITNFRTICRGKPSFIDLGPTDEITGQVKDNILNDFSDSKNDRFPDQNIDARRIADLYNVVRRRAWVRLQG